ncbi:nesprin-2-like isoform X3 [Betta splendens]|uniref:Nesprin-2-like isoform X3 n=1 Tax=Betta splendens TaxID=158456 RepID=A0A6P7LK59_BETSP|nr:nesprin-2-like isoform X3 [Betta splendens]
MKQTLISRKSKGLDVSSSQEPLSPPVGTTDVASVEVEKDIGREKTTSIVQTVTETTKSVIVVEESLSPSSGVSESSDICLSKKTEATEKPDSQISEAVVGKTKVIATRRTSEEGPECQQPCPAAHIITEPNETTAVEMGMVSPPKRKTKGLKPSPELATQVAAEITQEPVRQKSLEEPKTKQTQIIRKSNSFDIFAPQKTLSISGTTTQDDSNQTEKDATSVVQAVIRTAVGTIVEEVEQSPTTTVSTSSEVPHLGEEQSTEKPDSPVTDDAVVEPSRRTSKDIPYSQQPASSPDIIKGPTKTTDLELGMVLPPKRMRKGLKTSPEIGTKVVTEITREPVRQKCLEETQMKQTLISRKSKGFDVSSSQEPLYPPVGTIDVASVEVEKDIGREKTTSIVQTVTETTKSVIVVEESLSPSSGVSESSDICLSKKTEATDKPDSQISEAVVGKTKVIATRRTSEEGPEDQQPCPTPYIITEPTETTVVEMGKVLVPKRMTKGLKPSPELTTKVAAEITQEPVRQKSLEEPKSVLKEIKQTLIGWVSKGFDVSSPQEPLSPPVGTMDVSSIEVRKDIDRGKSTSVEQKVIETTKPIVVEERLLPTSRVLKSPDISPHEKTEALEKPDRQISKAVLGKAKVIATRRTSEEGPGGQQPCPTAHIITEPTETTVVEMGKVSPPKRKTKGLKTSPELGTTVITDITRDPVRQKSLEEPETKQTQIIRKSKSFDIFAPQKTLSISGTTTQDDSNQTEKDATSVVQAVIRTAVGTIVEEVEQSPTTTVSTSSEVPHLGEEQSTEKPNSPVTDDAVVESSRRTSKDIPYSQQPASSPDIIKGSTKTTYVELGKVSPPKRKTKGLKPSPELGTKVVTEITQETVRQKCLEETQMKQTIISRKSKGFDVSSSQEPLSPPVGTTDVASVEVEKDIGREKTTSIVQTVTETTKSVIVVEESLSPTSGVSESSDICLSKKIEATEKHDRQISEADVGKTKVIATRRTSEEGPEDQQPCPTAHTITEPNETTAVEMGTVSPPKRKTKGLITEISREPVRQKSLEEPETKQTLIIRKSKSFDISAPQKTLSISGTTTHDDSNQTEKDATSVVQTVIRTAVGTIVEEVEQSPTTTVSTSSKVSHLGEEQSTEKPDSSVTDAASVEPSRRTSKDGPGSQQPASSPDIIKGPTKTTDVELGKVSPPKRKTKGLKPSPELGTEVVTEITQEHVRQKSLEETQMNQTLISRKSKGFDVSPSQEPLSPPVGTSDVASVEVEKDIDREKTTSIVQTVTETTKSVIVVEESLSPTSGVSESSDICHYKETEATEKPDSQISEAVFGETKVIATRRTSEEGPEGQQPCPTAHIITEPNETTGVEMGKVSPPKRKTKGLKPSPELTSKVVAEIIQEPVRQKSLEEPETKQTLIIRKSKSFDISAPQKTLSISGTTTHDISNQTEKEATSIVQPVIRTAVGTIVEEVEQSPTTTLSTSSEVSHFGGEQSTEKPDSPVTDDDDVVEQSEFKQSSSGLITGPMVDEQIQTTAKCVFSVRTDTPHLTEYIDKLWKHSPEVQKRYLVLSLPEGAKYTPETKPVLPPVGPSTQHTSEEISESSSQLKFRGPTQDITKDDTGDDSVSFTKESSEILVDPSHLVLDVSEMTKEAFQSDTSQGRPPAGQSQVAGTEFIEVHFSEQESVYSRQAERSIVVLEQGAKEQLDSKLDERSVTIEKIQLGPEVHVLQLDLQTSPEVHKDMSAANVEPKIDVKIIHNQGQPESKIEITAEVMAKTSVGEVTKLKGQESSAECKEEFLRNSAQSTVAVAPILEPSETEFIEISLYEQDFINPSEDTKLLEKPLEVKEQPVHEEHSAHEAQEKKYLTMEKIPVEREVSVLQLDVPTTETQTKREAQNVDRTAGIHSKEAVVNTRVERKACVSYSGSTQLMANEAVTASAEIKLSKEDTIKPSMTVIKPNFPQPTEEKPKVVEKSKVQQDHIKDSTKDLHDPSQSLDKMTQKIKIVSDECISQPAAIIKEHETTSAITRVSMIHVYQAGEEHLEKKIASVEITKVKQESEEHLVQLQHEQHQLSTQELSGLAKTDVKSISQQQSFKDADEVVQLDEQTVQEEDQYISVTTAKKPMIETAETSVEGPENIYETRTDVYNEKAAVETKVKQGSSEREKLVQSDSTEPSSVASVAVQPTATEKAFTEVSEKDAAKPTRAAIKSDSLEATPEPPKELEDEEDRSTMPLLDLVKAPHSLDESAREEKSYKGAKVHLLQPDSQKIIKEHKITSYLVTETPLIRQTSVQCEEVVMKKRQTSPDAKPGKTAVEYSSTVQSTVEVKIEECAQLEQHAEVLTQDMGDPSTVIERSIRIERIHKEEDVCALQLDIATGQVEDENLTFIIAKEPRRAVTQTSIEGKLVAEKETVVDVHSEEAAFKTDDVSQSDAFKPVTCEGRTEFKQISFSEHERVQPSRTHPQLELFKSMQDGQTSIKAPSVQAKHPQVPAPEMDNLPMSQEATTTEKKKQVESGMKFETVRESKDVTNTDIQPDEHRVKIITEEMKEGSSESMFGLRMAPKTQITKKKTEEERESQGQGWETAVTVELPKHPLAVTTAVTTEAVTREAFTLPQVGYDAQLKSPESLTVSADFTLGEAAWEAGSPTDEEADVMTEELLEPSKGAAFFTEIQELAGAGHSAQLTEAKYQGEAPEALISSASDLNGCLRRLISKVLTYKSRPAELNPSALAQQIEEAQQCGESVQAQLSLFSQLSRADAVEHVETQWKDAAQHVAAVIQSKEAQLQLLTDYCTQTQTARTTVDRQTAEVDALKRCPEQSRVKEAEQICSIQTSMEERRAVLRELLAIYTKLCPALSRPERATARTDLKNLQEQWRGLERAVERRLHHINVHAHETKSLLSEITGLEENVETVVKTLEATTPSVSQWNCKKTQHLMEANADLKASQQKYLHLQQLSSPLLSSRWEKETREIQQRLQIVKDKISHAEDLVTSQSQTSSSPIMEKMIAVMRDGLAWAKQTETDIEGRRRRVSLLPEEVHQQLRDLKKLQSDVISKQCQLQALVEEVTELLPQLDQTEEVPMVHSSLEALNKLSKSTTEKLTNAMRDIESGLQTREKLSEQIADLDSWIITHLHREASGSADVELRSPTELDRRLRQIQETLAEAEKHAAVWEALLTKSKDISSELSCTENCQLFEKLSDIQEDIQAISSYEKDNKTELDELIQIVDSSKKNLVATEKSLRQMLVDVSKHRFPITTESLKDLDAFKGLILEHKSQVELLQPWIPQEKTRGLHSIMSEIHSKMASLERKACDHEQYLSIRQAVEDLKETFQQQVLHTKEDSMTLEGRYKLCQSLLIQYPLIKHLCEEARSKLQLISTDLYPSQLTAERQRLKQNEESLVTWQMTLYNNLRTIEWDVLKELDLDSERRATRVFLWTTQKELQKLTVLEPNDTVLDQEYQRIVGLKQTVESRIRALEVLEQKKGNKAESQSQDLQRLKKAVISHCDTHMENMVQARDSLTGYTCKVKKAVQFLRDLEASLLPLQGSAGPCSEQLEETQQALAALQEQFQTHVEELQTQAALHSYLSPQKVEQLQETILSQLLVKMSTLQAKGHMRLEGLSRCAEHHINYIRCQEEIMQSVKSSENCLLQLISQKLTSLGDFTDQEAKLQLLSQAVDDLLTRLKELKEWCPEPSCRGVREAVVTAVWKRVSRLWLCTQRLRGRSRQRITEWSDVTNSVEKASAVLEQVEAELPDDVPVKLSTEALHDLLQSWEQYQDRLDCEHRSLSALELRAARLLGVPAHLESAPPTPLCQKLQVMQARYASIKKKSREGLEAVRLELEQREKLWEELHGLRVWLEATGGRLSEMEQSDGAHELPEIHVQLYTHKALLQRIMDSLKVKYSDTATPVPVEVEGQLQGVTQSMKQVEVKVGEAVERSGPVHRLGVKLFEILAGLRSVQKRLEQRSPTVIEAKFTQKRVWDELDVWHSCLAALEVDLQDLEKPEDTLVLTEKLVEVQQFHSQLAKEAEQRTTLLSKIQTWLQEHQEMINSSKSWICDAQSWLAAPYTYTTAKCLSSHVHTLQMVLNDSAQIRTTLQGFSSVLQEMSQVCDIATLQEQLVEADRQVADVQDSFTAPLSQLEHAAAEVEAIEIEIRRMEGQVAEIKALLTSPESLPSRREASLTPIEQKIQSMRRTVAEIQKCKPGLCLPEKAEETLTVFAVVNQLQTLLLELEKKVPALFIQQPPTPVQAKASSALQPPLLKSTSEEEDAQGQIRIVHMEEDVLKRSGATLLTVEQSSPEQRQSWTPERSQLQAEEAGEQKGSEEQRVEEGGGGVFWWLWDLFLSTAAEEPAASEETKAATEQTEETQDVEGPTDTTEASSSEALSKPLATVRTQSQSESMELMKGQRGLAWRGDDSHPEGPKTHTVYSLGAHTLKESFPPREATAFRAARSDSREVDGRIRSVEPRRSPVTARDTAVSSTQTQAPAGRAAAASLQHQDAAGGRRPAQNLKEPGCRSGPCPPEGALHGCLDRVAQLEQWLQEAERNLLPAAPVTMQDSVERQLLTCQEMLMEIEQKVVSLSALTQAADRHQQEELGAVGSQQEVAELLSSKLQLLKLNLVSFQQLLQERLEEEGSSRELQEQTQGVCLPQQSKRSSSFQELFSSPRNKLLRQSSLQQQKELEQELTEQRGLTQAIIRLHSQDTACSAPAGADVEEDSAQKKWDHLHSRLLAVEESWLLPPSEVTDSSVSRTDGTAGCMIGTQHLKELQTHIILLRELGQKAAALPNQTCSVDVSHQTLDEGLFHVLCGASLSLSSLRNMLLSPAVAAHEGDAQLTLLQSLSAELATFSSELVSQGSKVSLILGSERGQRCVDDLSRILPVVEAALSSRKKQLVNTEQETEKQQGKLRALHAAFTSNQSIIPQVMNDFSGTLSSNEHLQAVVQMQERLQQQVEQVDSLLQEHGPDLPACLIHQATQLQSELDTALGGVGARREELRGSVELQEQYERLVTSLKELLRLGCERLAQQPELQSRAQLQQQLSSHERFFQFLGHRSRTLLYLTSRLPESALQRWEGVVSGLQEELSRLQQRGLERGASMRETLQMWLQWEEDAAWSETLLRQIDTSFPTMLGCRDSDEQILEKLRLLRELLVSLEQNEARLSRTLEAGRRLQRLGCRSVGASTNHMEAFWRSLHKRAEQERVNCDRQQRLRSRFLHDSAVLAEWMGGARELIDSWRCLSVSGSEEMDLEQRRDCYFQFVALTKELEPSLDMKVRVTGAGMQLVQVSDTEDTAPSQSLDLGLSSIDSQLRQLELDWSSLMEDVPVVQEALHARWMKTLTQQGALLELQTWLRAAESQLEEQRHRFRQTSGTEADLTHLLKHCKERELEMTAHQATLDYVKQPLQACGSDRSKCWEHNRFSEDQGCLNHQWLSLQEKLRRQIQKIEQDLCNRAALEARLTQINSWITDQNLWISSAWTPSSQTELRRSIRTCQDLGGEIKVKATALQKLRDQSQSICDFMSEADKSTEACSALTQQNESLRQRLAQTQQLWDSVDRKLSQSLQKSLRRSQTAAGHSSPQLCLQAQRASQRRLQLLQEETEAAEAEWEELSRSISCLREVISPAAASLVAEQMERLRESWAAGSAALDQQLQRSRAVVQVWEVYEDRAASVAQRLQTLQSDSTSLGGGSDDSSVEQLTGRVHKVQSLLGRTDTVHSDLQGALEASHALIDHLDPLASSLVQSQSRLLSGSVLRLRHMLQGKLGHVQEELQRLQEFTHDLDSLERNLELWQQRVQDAAHTEQAALLELSGLSADLDVLNELSCSQTPGDAASRRLSRLNRCWAQTSSGAEEACSELQSEALRQQSFQQKCESWMWFLQRMEDSVVVDVAGSYTGLRQQLRTHKRFQAELSIGHQILHSVVAEALHLLQRGEVEYRSDLILKLAQLQEHWQGAVQRAEQRRCLVEGLLKHWHQYSRSLRKLQKFLTDTNALLPPAGAAQCSLQQLRRSLQELLHTELLFQRYQCSFVHTLEIGRQLFSMGDEETQAQLQKDLGALQEEWEQLHSLLEQRIDATDAILKKWERCEAGLADSVMQLKDVKTRLNQSMPDCDDELQSAEKFNKENEDSLEDWAESLTELRTMKTDLSQYIITDDVLLLQEQVEHLHCQWEELCLKVSLRKQEIADRLNAWIVFNEKNKELCEWLTQMENKVAHSSELSIEEMVEKLKKDCMEEINLFSENKTHLKQLGEQLITASNKTKEAEVNDKLKDTNDRWQHLFDHIEARVRKLKETLVTVQQLDKNMSNLRTWLSRVEAALAKPLVYSVCHSEEIQKKLAEQQDLQRDIEQHTESVASVLTLCDVLLHDADACDGDAENDSIQQTSRSLDRRWRNICAMSMERRMRIEETWRLWSKFLDDYSRFDDWLQAAELSAANPDSANVLYTSAKEELKKFESVQRQVHERLTQLELVNKQYRRLARENRTDAASKLKVMVHEGNQRWDRLQKRVSAVLRRLKHFTSQREDFEGTREAILVWLTEMDLQLTNVEHFSESDVEDKMQQLNGFQQEITLNTNKIDALIVFGENLIQKSAALDAVLIEDELEELHSYCQEVFGRVARFHQRLVSRRPVLDDSPPPWRESREEEAPAAGVSAGRHSSCHLLAPPLERSGRETPVSVDSIPLEWDHTVDVGGSSSHEDDEDEAFFSALSVKSLSELPSWHQPGSPERRPGLGPRGTSSSPTHTGSQLLQQGYAKLMAECSGSIDSVQRIKLILNDDDEELDDVGLSSSTADKQSSTGVIQRWELLQAQPCDSHAETRQNLEQWQKLNSDLGDVTSWLDSVLPDLDRLQQMEAFTSIRDLEVNVKKLKEMQKTFNSYKCVMISVNLSSRHFLQDDRSELQEALASANHSWTTACSRLERWERRLQEALMQCQEFHATLHSLLLWLAQAENRLFSVDARELLGRRAAALEHRDALTALQQELRRRQRQVCSLQDISSQLLPEATADDSTEAKEKVHVIANKLRLLLRQVAADLHTLQGAEEVSTADAISVSTAQDGAEALGSVLSDSVSQEICSSSCEVDSIGLGTITQDSGAAAAVRHPATRRDREPPPRAPFLHRVLRAAFPLHLLLLVLLVLTCLVPLSEDDYSCTLSNNFARSFYPMLRYTNGPPPT